MHTYIYTHTQPKARRPRSAGWARPGASPMKQALARQEDGQVAIITTINRIAIITTINRTAIITGPPPGGLARRGLPAGPRRAGGELRVRAGPKGPITYT